MVPVIEPPIDDMYMTHTHRVFAILDPNSDCNDALLKMRGFAQKNAVAPTTHKAVRSTMTELPSCKHDTGGPDHILSIQTKVSLALIAQGKDNMDMWDQDKEIMMLTTRTSTAQQLMEVY